MKINYNAGYMNIFDKSNCHLIRRVDQKRFLIEAQCGHNVVTRVDLFKLGYNHYCKSCTQKKDPPDYKRIFEIDGCVFIEKVHNKFRYTAQCGHEHIISLSNFKAGFGKRCPSCSQKSDMNVQKGESFEKIYDRLKDHFEVRRTFEGCLADFIVRPLGSTVDEWLMIQLKTSRNTYSFHIHRKYPKCIMMCHALNDDILWCFKYSDFSIKSQLNLRKSTEYFTIDTLLNYYYTEDKVTCDEAMTLISPQQIREVEYRKKRELFYPHVHFEYPKYEQRRYNFIVNGLKYQEKVASMNKISYQVYMYSNRKPYSPGENDYYMIHIPDQDVFYMFPEQVLIDRNILDTGPCTVDRPTISISISNHSAWYQPYRHKYTMCSFQF